ncbi:sugar transferase [Gelidibacter gilvus]|uniref:Sugar transferase n=1 Tax=Gelidibacter gilvus TaxID=59602 RepID=A0A4Q0XBB4_9FLAO|nr:sugar transferase [Gelidibacter gilvus]
MSSKQVLVKRLFDLFFGVFLFPFLIMPIVLLMLLATIDTGQWGVFSQLRIGQFGKPFKIYKIRTLKQEGHRLGHLDASATRFGKFLRCHKLDELPQLFNVLKGDMSFVGPRPDLAGFADRLEGEDRIVLNVKPGITGPATLKYKDEELILAQQVDPENYNRTIIWVDKVEINKKYVRNWRFSVDLLFILKSIKNAS